MMVTMLDAARQCSNRIVAVCIVVVVLSIACALQGCGDDGGATPISFPSIPIQVRAAGDPPRIRTLSLSATLKPSYQSQSHVAWGLREVFGSALDKPATPAFPQSSLNRLAVRQSDGKVVDIDRPFVTREDGRVWILRTNRKAEHQLALIDPKHPFPAYHGRGGNRGRAKAINQQVRRVAGLTLYLGDTVRKSKRRESPMLELAITVDGEKRTLSDEQLLELQPLEVSGDSGKGARDAWDLRSFAEAIAGDNARVLSVKSRSGDVATISPEEWVRDDRVPLLKLNRRGAFKFHWADAKYVPIEDGAVRDVVELGIVAK